jgi:hypothetical protein
MRNHVNSKLHASRILWRVTAEVRLNEDQQERDVNATRPDHIVATLTAASAVFSSRLTM